MNRFSFATLVTLLGVNLVACDDGTDPGTDGGPTADAGPVTGEDAGPTECPDEVVVDGDITTDTTWGCPIYVLTQRVFVTDGATLTVAAGTTVYGEVGGSETTALVVTRGAQLVANGTAAEPIVFTSGNPDGERVTGDWAGVALLGDATINSGSCIDDADTTTEACDAPGYLQGRLEGIPVADDRARFGGSDDASSCGSLQYVRIEFAGAELSPDNELNGLTIGGCGSGTTLSYIQVHRGKDDGVELFGGTASLDHVVISGASDDSLDFDNGWRGEAQFVVLHQFPGIGDSAIEADSLGGNETAEPRTNPSLSNFTLIGHGDSRAMVLREGMRGALRNFVVVDFGDPPDLRAEMVDLSAEWPTHLSVENSYFFDIGAWPTETDADDDDGGFDEQAAFEDAARDNEFSTDPMIGDSSVSAPDYMPGVALPGVAPTFGDTSADYAGAFEMGGEDWTEGWTAFPAS